MKVAINMYSGQFYSPYHSRYLNLFLPLEAVLGTLTRTSELQDVLFIAHQPQGTDNELF